MDIDTLWSAFVKYRPMLDELFEHWQKSKSEEELKRPRTIDGRMIRDDELPQDDRAAALAGEDGQMIQPGDEDEVESLRVIADARGIDYDNRWKAARLRKELGFEEDEAVPVTPMIQPGDDAELDRLREIADERSTEYDRRWGAKRMRKELGFGKDEAIPVKTDEGGGSAIPSSVVSTTPPNAALQPNAAQEAAVAAGRTVTAESTGRTVTQEPEKS